MEFDKTPRFLYPRVAFFSDRRNSEKISLFVSLSDFSFPFSLVGFPPFLLCWLLSFSPLSNAVLPLFALHFISFSFSLFSHFLIPFFSFIFSFLFLLWIASSKWSQKWETSSPLPPLPLVILIFFLIFFYFPLFSSCDAWLNVSHLS